MLSRVADSLYWMARYMERAENLARLLLANQSLMLDSTSADDRAFWEPLLMTTGDGEGYHELFSEIKGDYVQDYLVGHPANHNSMLACIRTARENARMVRDQLPDEVWRAVNDLHLLVGSDNGAQLLAQDSAEFYEAVMRGSGLFQGAARATMMRDEGWQFLQVGTYLERADKTSRLIDTCSSLALISPPHPDAHPLRWQALLRSCSALHGYREHHAALEPRSVLEFLFLSERFARSVRFCVREVNLALKQLPLPPGTLSAKSPTRLATKLFNDIDLATIDEIITTGVHEFIDILQQRLNAVGEAIFETHVLYADLRPLSADSSGAAIPSGSLLGAWHHSIDMQVQQQQQ